MLAPIAAAQPPPGIEVLIDRRELVRGETLTLTIRIHDRSQGLQFDITPLTQTPDFDLLGNRTSSQIRALNGRVESWTDYIFTLFPLKEGELTIPSLSVNNTLIDPGSITVVDAGPQSNQSAQQLFLETEINKDSVYVQEQLLFTIRLYYTINNIRQPVFTDIYPPDTVTEVIGTNQGETLIDGVRYGIYEKSYVIFPLRSGEMVIPDILFRGEVTDGPGNIVFRNRNTRRVTAFTEGMTIEVKERPPEALGAEVWLPATELSISQSFTGDPGAVRAGAAAAGSSVLHVGDSIQRTITLTARGLDGAVLPPFSPEAIDGLNLYPNPPQIERRFENGGMVGSRTESTTLVPTRGGRLLIPAISIPWWNIETERMEYAELPEGSFDIIAVEGDVPSEQAVTESGNIEELLAPAPAVDQSMIDAQAEADTLEVSRRWLAYTAALLLLTAAGVGAFHLLLLPHRAALLAFALRQKRRLQSRYNPEDREAVAFQRLLAACRREDAADIRRALILWCGHQSGGNINTIEDILRHPRFTDLHDQIGRLQANLYQDAAPIDTLWLADTLKRLRRHQSPPRPRRADNPRYTLPPLYRV